MHKRRPSKARIFTIVIGLATIVLLAAVYHRGHIRLSEAITASWTKWGDIIEQSPVVRNITMLRQAADILDSELLSNIPQSFLPGYKSPCWDANQTASDKHSSDTGLRCLPYAYISGFSNGAVSLISKLSAHPSVVKDSGGWGVWGRSWDYWSEYRNQMRDFLASISDNGKLEAALKKDPSAIVIHGGLSMFSLYWAASGKAHRQFSTHAVACWETCNKAHKGGGPEYEKCMDQKCLPLGRSKDWEAAERGGLDYRRDVHLPLLIRAAYGDAPPRLVVLVRDPVERFISGYFAIKNIWGRHGRTPEGFAKFVTEQLDGWRACLNGTSFGGVDGRGGEPAPRTDEDCYTRLESLGMQEEKLFFHGDQLFRGLWAPYLRIWLRFLPPTHVLAINADDYFTQPDAATNRVLGFLGLAQLPPSAGAGAEDVVGAGAADAAAPTVAALAAARHRRTLMEGTHSNVSYAGSAISWLRQLSEGGVSGEGGNESAGYLGAEAAAKIRAAGSRRQHLPSELVGKLPKEALKALAAFYRPYNEDLARLLCDERILQWSKV